MTINNISLLFSIFYSCDFFYNLLIFLWFSIISDFPKLSLTFPKKKIFCLVRGKTDDFAKERLLQHLKSSKCEFKNEENLIIVASDLKKPNFGLSNEKWNNIVSNIKSIFHNGAIVNMALPYVALRYSWIALSTLRIIMKIILKDMNKRIIRLIYWY
jgi:L-aminoadipate-semialdehyde dehydrogenase